MRVYINHRKVHLLVLQEFSFRDSRVCYVFKRDIFKLLLSYSSTRKTTIATPGKHFAELY